MMLNPFESLERERDAAMNSRPKSSGRVLNFFLFENLNFDRKDRKKQFQWWKHRVHSHFDAMTIVCAVNTDYFSFSWYLKTIHLCRPYNEPERESL